MIMTTRIWRQLAILIVVSITAFGFMAFGYMRLPSLLFGVGRYQVTLQLPEASGLYERANVTYRGTQVGQVEQVNLTNTGVEAILALKSDISVPSDLVAEVHSTSAIGEQYVALLPRGDAPPLKDGDVISAENTRIPPDINALLDATDRGLQAIPVDNLQTAIDEGYLAFGGLGPDISRFVRASTTLASDAQANLDQLTTLIDGAAPVLNTQSDTSDSVQAWAANLAGITQQLKANDPALQGILQNGSAAASEVRDLFNRLQPTLPIVAANLASIAPVLVTYAPNLEQILVLLPMGTQIMQATGVPNRDTIQPYRAANLSFNLNLNLPPPCTTGYLPAQQIRNPSFEDAPDRPAGDVYCRIPQDSPLNVRGVRNTPCVTRPGKRAPTVAMCESDEVYVPLNDGLSWKGDPNATLSGQAIPQLPPGSPQDPAVGVPAPVMPPVAVVEYDPATGAYIGPDGQMYTQSNVAGTADTQQTWQSMLLPPATP